jgi:hypothetical protein
MKKTFDLRLLTKLFVVFCLCSSLISCGNVSKKPTEAPLDTSLETPTKKPSETPPEGEEISYLSNIPTYTPPIVVPSEPLNITTSQDSFQWIRSISPDLDIIIRAQTGNATLYSSEDSSLYALTKSSVLKTNELGDKEWSLGYWSWSTRL